MSTNLASTESLNSNVPTLVALRNKVQDFVSSPISAQNDGTLFTELLEKHYLATSEALRMLYLQVNSDGSFADPSIEQLKEFLTHQWSLIKGSCLSYTALNQSPLTEIMVSLAVYLTHGESIDKNYTKEERLTTELNYLMPGTTLETELVSPYPAGSWEKITLKQILKSFILSDNARYLLPVAELLDYNTTEAGLPRLRNQQELSPTKDDDCYFTHLEINRVQQHSELTQELTTNKINYDSLIKEDDSLLGQLNHLIRHLKANSVNGIGQEMKAAIGGNIAIDHFIKYFRRISLEDKEKIPRRLYQEIRLIHNCGGEYLPTESPIDIIDTCLATRKDELISSLMGYEVLLSSISTSKETRERLISESIQALSDSHDKLKGKLQEGQYLKGQDKHSIKQELLDYYDVPLNIDNFDNLIRILKPLTPHEIKTLFDKFQVILQIEATLNGIGDLVLIAISLSPNQLEAFLPLIASWFKSTANHYTTLNSLLINFENDREKSQVLIKAFIKSHPHIIGPVLQRLAKSQQQMVFDVLKNDCSFYPTASSLLQATRNWQLTSAPFSLFLESISHRLPDLIKTNDHLIDFLKTGKLATAENQLTTLNALKNQLPELIVNAEQLVFVLNVVNNQNKKTVMDVLTNNLNIIIKNGVELGCILKKLPNDLKIELFNHFYHSKKIPELINNGLELESMMSALEPREQSVALKEIKRKAKELVQENLDLKIILSYLDKAEQKALLDEIKDCLVRLIKTGSDLKNVLLNLDASLVPLVFNAVIDNVSASISNSNELFDTICYLEGDHIKTLFKKIEKKILTLIHNGEELNKLLWGLSDEQTEITINLLKDKLPLIITNSKELVKLLAFLNSSKTRLVIKALSDVLPNIVFDLHDVIHFETDISEEKSLLLTNLIQNDLKKGLLDKSPLSALLIKFSHKQVNLIIDVLIDELPKMVFSVRELNSILSLLSGDCRIRVLMQLEDLIIELINNKDELEILLGYKTIAEKKIILLSLEKKLSTIEFTTKGLLDILSLFETDDQDYILKIIGKGINKPIKTSYELYSFIKSLTVNQRGLVLNLVADRLVELTRDADDLDRVIYYLNSNQLDFVLDKIKDNFSLIMGDIDKLIYFLGNRKESDFLAIIKTIDLPFIASSSDLRYLLSPLSSKNQKHLFDHQETLILKVIKNGLDLKEVLSKVSPNLYNDTMNLITSNNRMLYFDYLLRAKPLDVFQNKVVIGAIHGVLVKKWLDDKMSASLLLGLMVGLRTIKEIPKTSENDKENSFYLGLLSFLLLQNTTNLPTAATVAMSLAITLSASYLCESNETSTSSPSARSYTQTTWKCSV